jgi:tetratricopeptide (TPR) repeat protein
MSALRKYPALVIWQIVFAGIAMVFGAIVLLGIYSGGRVEYHTASIEESKVDMLSMYRNELLLLQKHQKNAKLASEYLSQGISYAQHGRWQQAVMLYNQAITLDSTNPNAFQMRGYLLYKMKKYSSSTKDLEYSVALNPSFTWGHYNLALAYWASGSYEKAMAEVREVLHIDSGFKNIFRTDEQFSPFRSSAEFRKIIE